MTNEERANTVRQALRQFRRDNCPNEDLRTAAGDFVSNLLHLVRIEDGINVGELRVWLNGCLSTHDEELEEETP